MRLIVGKKVVYPCQGPCLVSSIVEKVVAGKPVNFYQLNVLDVTGGELFVPVDKVPATGIRMLLKKSQIVSLLSQLMKTTEINRDWKQRAKDTLKLFSSGSAFDLAQIVESLTTLSERKSLSVSESWTLEKARKLLICEISEVIGQARSVAEEQIELALKARVTAIASSVSARLTPVKVC